ncbi:MAG TPA: NHL repeat-containing protein [Verrucomicrobiae bacterium]|nr:NHL repeat-containing protein [Verrucomicrobiae bacterium]
MNIRWCISVIGSGTKARFSGGVISPWISLLLLTHPGAACGDNLFVSTGFQPSITEFDSSGTGRAFYAGLLTDIDGLALDQLGNLYAASGCSITKFNSSGTITTTLGQGKLNPFGLAFDSAGDLYAAGGGAIWKFNSGGGTGTVFATLGDFDNLKGLAFDSAGNLYAADDRNSGAIEEFGTNGVGRVFASAGLNWPCGLAFDSAGNLYVANQANNTIEIFGVSGIGKVFADSGLAQPCGLAFDSAGDLYVANNGNGTIEKFSLSGGVLSSSGTLFASGLSSPEALVSEMVPEPSAGLLITVSLAALLPLKRRRNAR